MQLLDITLHNFKAHTDLTLDFVDGVTGIVGKNGTGKSSIFAAIEFLLTGTVDTDQKSDCITLGQTEGWVSGNFLLQGKEGYLERHLSVSKTVLRYDGKSYNKATEVKDLWAKLMQIDPTIFHNVIIAGQGVIPLLFDGDQSVREKIFQRIFMVPATEKMRAMIWDKYIKQAPLEQVVEDVSILQARQADVATQANQLNRAIDERLPNVLATAALTSVQGRINYLDKCIRDAAQRPALGHQLEQAQTQQTLCQERLATELAVDASLLPDLKSRQILLIKQDQSYRNYQTVLKQHTDLLSQLALVDMAALDSEFEAATTASNEINDSKVTLEAKIRDVKLTISQLSGFVGIHKCPTCKQDVKDTAETVAELKKQLRDLDADTAPILLKTAGVRRRREAAQNAQLQAHQHETRRVLVANQLTACNVTAPVEDELREVNQQLARLDQAVAEMQRVTLQESQLATKVAAIQGKLNNLGCYDSTNGTAEDELQLMQEVLVANQSRHDEIANLRNQMGQATREIELLDERIATSKLNRAVNDRRQQYVDTLQGIYELLSTSVFPRMLIESYGQYVEKHLQRNLEHFNYPYRARIAQGFRIELLDREGRVLPTVSGGQKVVVGICLRLALHRMFAQSFPMWLIDEGTTHLDNENRELYFQMIEQLKKDEIIKQIIIIDHDSQLSRVVDKVITITN